MKKILVGLLVFVSVLLCPLRSIAAVGKPKLIKMIVNEALRQGVNPAVALAVAEKESGFKPSAIRPEKKLKTNSYGLFQLLLTTAKAELNFRGPSNALFQPELNIRLGIQYIKRCYEEIGSSVENVACCYNAGFYASERFCRSNDQVLVYTEDLRIKTQQWALTL